MRSISEKLALVLAATLTGGIAGAADTVRIGALLIDSGPLAGFYEASSRALDLAETHLNENRAPGMPKVEIVRATYAGTPETALQAATRLVKNDGVQVLTGMLPSSASIVLAARAEGMGTVVLDGFSQAASMTKENCRRNYFHISTTDDLIVKGYEALIAEQGAMSWDVLAADYATGRDAAKTFEQIAAAHGGQVGETGFAPMGTADFGPYIARFAASPSKGLFISTFGSDAINFAKQHAQFRLDEKYEVILGHSYVTRTTIGAQGESVVGNYQAVGWTASFPEAESAEFVKRYQARYASLPDYVAADQYVAIQAAQAGAAAATDGSPKALVAALEGLSFDSLLGEVTIRPGDHQLIRPVLITRIVEENGEPAFRIESIVPGHDVARNADPACTLTQ